MAAASVDDPETSEIPSEKESDDANNQMVEIENKVKLSELKVADLRVELEKRDLDKSGVKSVLFERLKTALQEEGKDVDEYTFILSGENVIHKSNQEKDKIPDSETNGEMEIIYEVEENKSDHYKDCESTIEDKASNEVTLQISIDEEEAQLNDDETLELNKESDVEIDNLTDKVVEDINQSNLEPVKEFKNLESNKSLEREKLQAIETTPNKISKVTADDLKEKKPVKTSRQKTELTSSVSPKVLKVIGKNDKIKSANVLAKSLWVTGLPNTTRAADLKALFSKHGKVSSVKIVKSTKQTPAKCYAFVTMAASKDATKAIQNLHRIEFKGRVISVERTQSEPTALLKKTESKVISLASKKPAAKKDASKAVQSTKPAPESKSVIKSESKSNEPKSSAEAIKPKENKIKVTEKAKSKEKEQKSSKEYKDRDVRRPPVKRQHPSTYKPRSFAFNDRRRFPTFRRPFGSRPFRGRSGFGTSSFRPRSDVPLYEKMREERIRRERFRDRERREADRRREYIERKQREEAFRLEREKEKLRIEREMLEREKAEILKLEREKQRLERERLEREREELRRQAELRRGVKRPYRMSRDVNTYWEDRKKTPRYEERSSFHGEKLRLEPSSSSKYEYLPRERPSVNRHEYDRHSERLSSSKALHTTTRSDFGDRDSRREVTIRSREVNPVYDRNEFRDRDSRRSFPPRERQSSSRRDSSREDWKHDRRVHERIVPSTTSSGQRRMTYY